MKKVFLALFIVLIFTPTAMANVIGQYEISLTEATTPESALNACLAGLYLNQTIVQPGEEFSFNRTVGERLAERYFVLAPIASRNKQTIYDYGGGICMTAGILHQAVKAAGLEVVERNDHVIRVRYLPPGEDAAITWGYQDFRFKNSLDKSICLNTVIHSDSLKIEIREVVQ
ncbi:MAG TPA: VanW family protein [Chitinophagaceae bacterium]|jgi:vancomycin resistance protein YoaR|nr:VanW family protein [Chitinophagaceae bacterium]